MRAAATVAAKELEQRLLPMKPFREVDQFLDLFGGQPLHRRPILAIIGGTNLGKSMLAAHVLRRLGEIVGVPGFLELTVEMNDHLDLADFDYRRHAGMQDFKSPPMRCAYFCFQALCQSLARYVVK